MQNRESTLHEHGNCAGGIAPLVSDSSSSKDRLHPPWGEGVINAARTVEQDGRDGFVNSLARGLAVIRAFRPGQERLTMAEVASAARLTRAGARRLLLTLKGLGYVDIDGRDFFLTPRILDLSQGYLGQTLWNKVQPVLQSIANTINETVSAGVLEGFDVVYTVRVRSARLLHVELDVGAHLPAHASSLGRVLLSTLSGAKLESYLRQATFTRYTKLTITEPDMLRQELKKVRQQGWSATRGEIDEGLTGVAVPLLDRRGRTVAALGVSMSSNRTTLRAIKSQIVPLLHDSAAAVTKSL